jgi:hypothetical protein
MSYTLYKQATFTTGLGTVGYALFNADATPHGVRITAGVVEFGASGVYGATVTIPDSFDGVLLWDDGAGHYISEAINSQTIPYTSPPGATYATLDDLRAYLKLAVGETADDALLSALLVRVQALIDSQCARTFAATSDSTRAFDCDEPTVEGPNLYFDGDLCAITTVTNGNGVEVTSGEYVTLPRHGTPYYGLQLRAGSGKSWNYTDDPLGAITVLGRWAYSASAPADIQQAALVGAAALYRAGGANPDADRPVVTGAGTVIQPGKLPATFWTLIQPYRRLM